jgi:hypothetical protein
LALRAQAKWEFLLTKILIDLDLNVFVMFQSNLRHPNLLSVLK